MKYLFFILLSGFCYSQESDSVRIMEKLKQLDEVTKETKLLIQKADKLEKERAVLLIQLKNYINTLSKSAKFTESKKIRAKELLSNDKAVRVDNINEPVTEYEDKYNGMEGFDSIKRSWLYRLLHKDKYLIKRFKIINNEKVYID